MRILKKKENELKDKINLIKIQNNDEISKKQNIINAKQNILNNIENQLNEYINKLTTFNTLSFSSLTNFSFGNSFSNFSSILLTSSKGEAKPSLLLTLAT